MFISECITVTEFMNHNAVRRIAPATPGLLIREQVQRKNVALIRVSETHIFWFCINNSCPRKRQDQGDQCRSPGFYFDLDLIFKETFKFQCW